MSSGGPVGTVHLAPLAADDGDRLPAQHPVLCAGQPCAGRSVGRSGTNPPFNPEKAELLKRQFGLDKPLPVQYLIWLVGNDWMQVDKDGDGIGRQLRHRQGILRGDFGFSFRTRQPVLNEIGQRLPNTIYLMTITMLVAHLIAIPIGIISAIRQYSTFDITVTTFSFAGQAIPEFWLGLILILIFYAWLKNPFTGDLASFGRHAIPRRGLFPG